MFFSETTKQIDMICFENVSWMVLCRIYVFCADRIFKMATKARLVLTLNPMGIYPNIFLTRLVEIVCCVNDPWIIFYKSFIWQSDRKDSFNFCTVRGLAIGPFGKFVEIFSCLRVLICLKCFLSETIEFMEFILWGK